MTAAANDPRVNAAANDPNDSYDPIRRSMAFRARKAFAVLRVVEVLHALGSHVHGDYVADAIARERACDVRIIEASVPASVICYAEEVLKVSSGVTIVEQQQQRQDLNALRLGLVIDGVDGGEPCCVAAIELRPHFFSNFSKAVVAFDRQILSLSKERLYKRCVAPGTVQSLLGRAKAQRFCLAPSFCASAVHHARAMRDAVGLLDAGWTMDDAMAGRDAWVAFGWSERDGAQRVDAHRVDMHAHDECPICQEKFKTEDVVVNLPCNHNFHAACENGRESSGICFWLEKGVAPRATCPCCRAPVYQ